MFSNLNEFYNLYSSNNISFILNNISELELDLILSNLNELDSNITLDDKISFVDHKINELENLLSNTLINNKESEYFYNYNESYLNSLLDIKNELELNNQSFDL